MFNDRVIEEILSAWWQWERCEPGGKAASLEILNRLLDEIRQGTLYSRQQILDHLHGHFLEFKRDRITNGQPAANKESPDRGQSRLV